MTGRKNVWKSVTIILLLLLVLPGILVHTAAMDNTVTFQKPFGPNAPWNIPVAGIPVHAQSEYYSNLLWNNAPAARPGNFNVSTNEYTYPVYELSNATGWYRVYTEWDTNIDNTLIPWNPTWQPAPGTDAQMIILDPDTGREWDLWKVSFANNTVYAKNGSLVSGNYWTKEDGNSPSRGCGIQYLAMLVRPEEIIAGEIRHALSMPIRNTDGDFYVAPATKLEHPDNPTGIPEGMRFALNVSDQEIEDWINSLPKQLPAQTKSSARTIAKALRDYGWFITDTSGGASIQLESRASAGNEWDSLGLGYYSVYYEQDYPSNLLDGLMKPERIYALVPSDQYPNQVYTTATPSNTPESTPTTTTPIPTATTIPTTTTTTPTPTPTVLPSQTPQINMISNPKFESGYLNWDNWGNCKVVAQDVLEGSYSMRAGTKQGGCGQTIKSGIEVGSSYTLCVWSKVSIEGEKGYIGVKCYNAQGEQMVEFKVPRTIETKYTQKNVTFTVPEGTVKFTVFMWKDRGKGYLYCDNMELYKN